MTVIRPIRLIWSSQPGAKANHPQGIADLDLVCVTQVTSTDVNNPTACVRATAGCYGSVIRTLSDYELESADRFCSFNSSPGSLVDVRPTAIGDQLLKHCG